jgi:hypothetical protein
MLLLIEAGDSAGQNMRDQDRPFRPLISEDCDPIPSRRAGTAPKAMGMDDDDIR